jgi:hypothetical protein
MTLAVDTSALVARHLAVPARAVAVEAMRDDPDWCASALALTEALVLIDRLTDDPGLRTDLEDAVRLDWYPSMPPAWIERRSWPAPGPSGSRTRSTSPRRTGSRDRCASSPSTLVRSPSRSPWGSRSSRPE